MTTCGTYLLILLLRHPLVALPVGRLGRFDLAAGCYLYVGSAYGPGGLPARLAYHARREKAHPRWHVDYLRAKADLVETWAVACATRLETPWVRVLSRLPGLSVPIPRFGASDTSNRAHLLFSPERPAEHAVRGAVDRALAEAGVDLGTALVSVIAHIPVL
jgi:Uri superfamily endonuclease